MAGPFRRRMQGEQVVFRSMSPMRREENEMITSSVEVGRTRTAEERTLAKIQVARLRLKEEDARRTMALVDSCPERHIVAIASYCNKTDTPIEQVESVLAIVPQGVKDVDVALLSELRETLMPASRCSEWGTPWQAGVDGVIGMLGEEAREGLPIQSAFDLISKDMDGQPERFVDAFINDPSSVCDCIRALRCATTRVVWHGGRTRLQQPAGKPPAA